MACEVERRGSSIHIAGEMTIYAAASLKETLLTALAETGTACILNLSQVTEIDTAGLQMLLLVKRSCAARGIEFEVLEPSEAVSESFGLLHMSLAMKSHRGAAERAYGA